MLLAKERQDLLTEQIMAITHRDCCYIFDLFDDGMLVSARAPEAKRPHTESIRAHLDILAWEELRAHLLSYSLLPMVVDTAWGTGIVLPSLAPSASLGVLCIPDIPREILIRLAKSGVGGSFAFASSTADVRARMGKKTDAYLPTFEAWVEEILTVLDGLTLPVERDVRAPIGDLLCERVMALSRYVGCPVAVQSRNEIVSYGDFEYSLFVAFVLMALCLARRAATNRSAEISLGMTSFGGTVSMTMAKRENLRTEELQELLTLRALAERKNMPFSYAEEDGLLCIRFSPVAKDWSYLELKTPNTFDWLSK